MSSAGAEILEVVRALARARRPALGPIELTSRLVEDLGLDSLELLTLAVELEDHFAVSLDEHDEAGLATVGDLVSTILRSREEAR